MSQISARAMTKYHAFRILVNGQLCNKGAFTSFFLILTRYSRLLRQIKLSVRLFTRRIRLPNNQSSRFKIKRIRRIFVPINPTRAKLTSKFKSQFHLRSHPMWILITLLCIVRSFRHVIRTRQGRFMLYLRRLILLLWGQFSQQIRHTQGSGRGTCTSRSASTRITRRARGAIFNKKMGTLMARHIKIVWMVYFSTFG